MDKEIKQEFENLAIIVKRGFDGVYETMDKRFDVIEADIRDIKEDIHQIRIEMKQIWSKLEEIEQKLGRIAQTSKEDTDTIVGDVFDLRQRVEFLENRLKKLRTAQ